MEPAGSTMMQSWIRFMSFGIIAAALVMFAAFNSRAKAPRANSAFPRPALDQPVAATKGKEVAVISGGGFWGILAVYELTKGLISATSGYDGGKADPAPSPN